MSQTVEENGGDKGESYEQNFFLKWDFAFAFLKKNLMPKKVLFFIQKTIGFQPLGVLNQ